MQQTLKRLDGKLAAFLDVDFARRGDVHRWLVGPQPYPVLSEWFYRLRFFYIHIFPPMFRPDDESSKQYPESARVHQARHRHITADGLAPFQQSAWSVAVAPDFPCVSAHL